MRYENMTLLQLKVASETPFNCTIQVKVRYSALNREFEV